MVSRKKGTEQEGTGETRKKEGRRQGRKEVRGKGERGRRASTHPVQF